jgi:hypothetical protein
LADKKWMASDDLYKYADNLSFDALTEQKKLTEHPE